MNGLVALLSAGLLLAWNPIAPANVGPPPKKPERVVAAVKIERGEIKGEGRGVQAKIIIPKGLVHGGTAGAAPAAAPATRNAPAPAAPAPAAAPAPGAREQASLGLGTIIAGLCLSLAAVSLVFVVRGNRGAKTTAPAVVAGALVLGAFSAANADLIPGRPLGPAPGAATSAIVIELVDGGDTVTLQLAR